MDNYSKKVDDLKKKVVNALNKNKEKKPKLKKSKTTLSIRG
jgi:hypothetical protein